MAVRRDIHGGNMFPLTRALANPRTGISSAEGVIFSRVTTRKEMSG